VWLYAVRVIPPLFDVIDRGEFLANYQVTPPLRAAVVQALAHQMETRYVDAARGRAAAQRLRARLAKGGYDALREPRAFADELTADVRGDTDGDRNLAAVFVASVIPANLAGGEVVDARLAWDARAEGTEVDTLGLPVRTDGVAKYEVLSGNVGYLRVTHFNGGAAGLQRYADALEALHDTRMLILDLRDNTGGSNAAAVQLASYFFAQARPAAMVETRVAPEKWTRTELVTAPVAPALAYVKQPVIVVTSRETVSAGETLAWVLKHSGRAKLLGESTRGGSHPAQRVRLAEHFGATIPNARIFDPLTHEDWERSGVVPDRYLLAYQALEILQRELRGTGTVKTTPDA
jgi:hypothetical protein